MVLFAHTPNEAGEWHLLDKHLRDVAELAAEHAAVFGAGDIAWWAGILHDAGKASEEFQRYLKLCHEQPERKPPTIDHKGAGFIRALNVFEPLAVLVQAHHGGLIDSIAISEKFQEYRSRGEQLGQVLARYDQLALNPENRPYPDTTFLDDADPKALEFWLRMLFSALVDADHLDTERHWNPETADLRGGSPPIADLWNQFETKQVEFLSQLDPNTAKSEVNQVRAEVYDACVKAAELPCGFYRLTVPTGGGKTRSGIAFALKHAFHRELRRVIVAVPFLTITDQTARIVNAIFPDERVVLEHHSAAGQPNEDADGSQDERESWRRLAVQDWNAPIIITTMVQLFESLLGRKTSVCRKLHRIAKSVIILDEAQTIPPTLRGPIFDVLNELVTNYGVTVVLCTATQPALDTLPEGVKPTEIVPEPARLFRVLERVRYVWPGDSEERWSWERVADEMRADQQSLAIVNTVANAQALFTALGDQQGHFHLSSRMCGAHRRDVLDLVRTRLSERQTCRLVSTQVVEAGVDLDFPLLLRALGPLDRIVQAAGRCNREGNLAGKGQVVVFDPEDGGMPPGPYQVGTKTTGIMRKMLTADGELDLNDPSTFAAYFTALHRAVPEDAPQIQTERAKLNFKTVAEEFNMIDNDQVSVIVRYRGLNWDPRRGKAPVDELIEDIEIAIAKRNSKWLRGLIRRVQPFIVNVRRRPLQQYADQQFARELTDDLWLWFPENDDKLGLVPGRGDAMSLFVG